MDHGSPPSSEPPLRHALGFTPTPQSPVSPFLPQRAEVPPGMPEGAHPALSTHDELDLPGAGRP